MKINKMSAVAILASMGLAPVMIASPAHAYEYEGGYKSCAGINNNQVATRGDSAAGSQTHVQNGGALYWAYSAVRHVRVWNDGNRTANWKVESSSSLYNAGTYAYCPG